MSNHNDRSRHLIDAQHALDFLRQLTELQVREGRVIHPEYQRGTADLGERYALYLEGLLRDPESDREVAA